uniref:Uncharacterized protein n=1 Tax=Anopheles epiroticus TaxID=199890 RepID=A0A182P2K5_9DIPT
MAPGRESALCIISSSSRSSLISYCCWALLLMCLTIAVAAPVSAENHCSEHRYEHSLNTHHLQFTKEIPDREYGVLKQFKSLHCCGKGYRSIEW